MISVARRTPSRNHNRNNSNRSTLRTSGAHIITNLTCQPRQTMSKCSHSKKIYTVMVWFMLDRRQGLRQLVVPSTLQERDTLLGAITQGSVRTGAQESTPMSANKTWTRKWEKMIHSQDKMQIPRSPSLALKTLSNSHRPSTITT